MTHRSRCVIAAFLPPMALCIALHLAPLGEPASGRAQELRLPTASPASIPESADTPAEQLAALAAELRNAYSKPPTDWPAPNLDPGVRHVELGLLPPVVHPADNPFSREKADLGRQLFFDPRMSGSGQIACASCHDPDLAWADGRTVAFGHGRQAGRRNTPSVMNAAFQQHQFWDGRATSLESQARMPVLSEIEMHASPDDIAQRINQVPQYRAAFQQVFGVTEVTFDEIAKAIACFERTIVGGRSAFDEFLRGRTDALNDSAIRGLHLFRTKARCINCHNGPNFTDDQFHNIGLTYYGRKYQDLGRYLVTKRPEDIGRFKTPSLRNVTRTAPYMHNGLFELDGVINLYNAGGPTERPTTQQLNDPLFPKKDPLMRPLGLNRQERADLRAFLESLQEPKLRVRPPTLPQ